MFLEQTTIDPAQIFSWKVTAWMAMITAGVAIWQAYESLKQRRRESRANQAALARDLDNEIFEYAPSAAALDLLDEDIATFKYQGHDCDLKLAELEQALVLERVNGLLQPKFSDAKAKAMRRCFDALFYYFDRFDRFVEVGVLLQEDIETPWGWYISQMIPYKKSLVTYAGQIGYPRALTFMNKFELWRTAT